MAANIFIEQNGIIKMKLSIVLSTQPASFSALAYKGNIKENILKLKELGYDGVELAVRNPNELNIENIKSIIFILKSFQL